MRVLIVGGAGFVGTNLARLCAQRGDDVVVLDSLDPYLRSTTAGLTSIPQRIQFIHADVCDDAAVARAVHDRELVVNCAGQTSHTLSMQAPQLDVQLNCTANIALLEAVRSYNRDAIVLYVSTSTVVGRATAPVIDETHLEAPLDVYSANKLAAEKYYRIYHSVHGLKTIVLRFPNLYGRFGKPFPEFGFINYFIALAAAGGELPIFGPGNQLRNVLYVVDACEAMLAAVDRLTTYGTPLFAVHDTHISVGDIAREIVGTFGGSIRDSKWPEGRNKIEVHDQIISGARFRGAIDWAPRYSFRDGLQKMREAL